jgi:hypothetical protein
MTPAASSSSTDEYQMSELGTVKAYPPVLRDESPRLRNKDQ